MDPKLGSTQITVGVSPLDSLYSPLITLFLPPSLSLPLSGGMWVVCSLTCYSSLGFFGGFWPKPLCRHKARQWVYVFPRAPRCRAIGGHHTPQSTGMYAEIQ